MSKITVQKDKNNPYIMMDKTWLQDDRLSRKAKWILAYLISLPDDRQIYISELTKHSKDGRDSTTSWINELIDNGYIHREKIRNDRWQFEWYDYIVYEKPYTEPPIKEKPNSGNPVSVNPTLLIKKELISNNTEKEIEWISIEL